MDVTLSVRRFNPDADEPVHYYQEYRLEVEESSTVLDGLIKVREEIDGSLALRCSCRSAICGSCAMRINGQATLACNTKVVDASPTGNGAIVVEPAANMEVIKDLVVDFKPFWEKVMAVEPWLQPKGPEPEQEYIASNESMLHLAGVMDCIMCGACVSDCTVLEVDSNFLGPAALAKAYRFVGDPRDAADVSRLGGPERVRGHLGLYPLHAVRRGVPQGRRSHGPNNGAPGQGYGGWLHQDLRRPPCHRVRRRRGAHRPRGRTQNSHQVERDFQY